MLNESPSSIHPDGEATASSSGLRRRIKQMEVMVADVIAETPDTTTLVLFTGNDRLDHRAGHFDGAPGTYPRRARRPHQPKGRDGAAREVGLPV